MSIVHSAVNQTTPTPISGASEKSQTQLALELNSCRIVAVAEQLAMCAKIPDQHLKFHQLCLSLASDLDNEVDEALQNDQHFRGDNCSYVLRGIDYGLANNEVPAAASKLPQVLKLVCCRKNDVQLQAAIMVLMISVKNACKLGWFTAKDTEELQKLADDAASYFVTKKDLNTGVCNSLPIVSTIMSRFYPRLKLGHIITSLEIEPGYGTHLVDFHISKDTVIRKDEKIRLFVAMKDSIDTSSCIITPQKVNILLNGKPVDQRNCVSMDHGPQLPTIVNSSLKYGINLLQVMGQFAGNYILIVALMSVISPDELQPPADYVQPVSAVLSSDSEIIEGPSRVSLNCPISKTRIRTPVKGNLCKHYQCFDFTNYVEINCKRPAWRCPSCNQSLCFTDLRVDQKMVQGLQDMGENVSEVMISVDGTWTAASSEKRNDESHQKTSANRQEGQELEELSGKLDAPDNMYDLTGDDDEMDIGDCCEPVDTKPVIHNVQGQSAHFNSTLPPLSRSIAELNQYSSGQVVNSTSPTAVFNSGSVSVNLRPHMQVGGTSGSFTGNGGIIPVLTDAVSPALNRQPNNFQGTSFSQSSNYAQNSTPVPSSMQLQEAFIPHGFINNFNSIPRNVTRVSSAIQALPVQLPTTTSTQHSRPTVSLPSGSGSSAPFQRPVVGSNGLTSPRGNNVERQRHFPQQFASPHMSKMASHTMLNRAASQGAGLSGPGHNMPMPQTLSQPPHLMGTSQLPRHNIQHGVGPRMGGSNSPSTLQRVQLTPSQASHVRQHSQATSPQASHVRQHSQATPPQMQAAARMTSPSPLNSGVTPQAVSRTESLIDTQAEHNWRPSGRMRGALTGKAYSDAMNQFMGSAAPPVQTPNPRPQVSPASPMPSNVSNIMLANQRVTSELQSLPATPAGGVNTQGEGSQGAK